MTVYGYARVSSKGQDLTVQLNALRDHSVEGSNIFKEKISGRQKDNRQEFNRLLELVQAGDTIVVTKLDRFARSTRDALNTIELLNKRNVNLVVLNMSGDKIDTSTPIGKLLLTVLAGIAEFEADLSRERQAEGIELAKQRGVYKGRPKKYTHNNPGLQHALNLMEHRDENRLTVNQISEITKISRATLYRAAQRLFTERS